MARCFVIQPFDRAQFDKRFDDVLTPAIINAGLEAYRVDRDPSVVVPIDAIETEIRDAEACVADISTDNPNVWFEVGYALAYGKPLVLICDASRMTPFPFDVQHRHVIAYKTEAPRDFSELGDQVTKRLQASLRKQARVQTLAASPLADTEGLEPHEIAALVIVAQSELDPEDAPSAHALKQDMVRAGYTNLATVLAVKALRIKGLVESVDLRNYNNEPYTAFTLTNTGIAWLMKNQGRLAMRHERRPREAAADDLPF
jgi:hypothetical protein